MSSAGEVRYARSSGTDEVSSNSLVKVRVRVRERMGGGLADRLRVNGFEGFKVGKVSIYT